MKYYKLKKDLPTFEEGELFILQDDGNLWHSTGGHHVDVVAYTKKTLEKFPRILKDWFEPAPDPVRDQITKNAFIAYLSLHKDERFFQAIRNFTRDYLKAGIGFIFAGYPQYLEDTFNWECDEMLLDTAEGTHAREVLREIEDEQED